MAYLLQLETATKNCSVAVSRDGQTIALREVAEQGFSHAEKLHLFIEQAMLDAQITYADLSAVAVSQGPGSYTGLRIGVSAAKGLCFALGIPLVAIDTLAVLAAQVTVSDGLIIPMIDARRMEVYSAVFDANRNAVRGVQAEILTAESYADTNAKMYIVGDCQQKCKTVLTDDRFVFLEDVVFPSANAMGALAHAKFLAQDFVDVAYFEPYYLKDFLVGGK
ncbi:tRNA (adenosine(37)-N6)-threonylcarbamoyltransferase complex dimerization subunit type 1 TsaB [Flavobacterium caeni]|uniref:tRNA threonylcarbamoyladenosine biosynthesis protein TsaB n=1 Tax=Flavobacterium caeni TaxID=490189 RepID=A0A1G5IA77_9FLAO|nr:tRNA (adenosine(37)-N6)-threonylcarbamoyltransferase complex dimerization subunit type 1 TsaB [Flavobacterium caeni]SCY73012.1 tRNA threonylcarbamoyladenosine biosynthesis protein TsaB [Flavobacterium caeni]